MDIEIVERHRIRFLNVDSNVYVVYKFCRIVGKDGDVGQPQPSEIPGAEINLKGRRKKKDVEM